MQGDRELDDTEARREMSANLAYHVDHAIADVLRDLRQLRFRQIPQVCGRQDPIQ
jgi:hypothetical protein